MTYLLEIRGLDASSKKAAALMDIPLNLRVRSGCNNSLNPLSTAEILTTGSANDIGLEALFAHKIRQQCAIDGCSVKKVQAIVDGNFGQTLNTRSDISCICRLLPLDGDSRKLLAWVFGDGTHEGIIQPTGAASEPNDFRYFYTSTFLEPNEITPGMITIACIYRNLQSVNHINPCKRLEAKIDMVLKSLNS